MSLLSLFANYVDEHSKVSYGSDHFLFSLEHVQ